MPAQFGREPVVEVPGDGVDAGLEQRSARRVGPASQRQSAHGRRREVPLRRQRAREAAVGAPRDEGPAIVVRSMVGEVVVVVEDVAVVVPGHDVEGQEVQEFVPMEAAVEGGEEVADRGLRQPRHQRVEVPGRRHHAAALLDTEPVVLGGEVRAAGLVEVARGVVGPRPRHELLVEGFDQTVASVGRAVHAHVDPGVARRHPPEVVGHGVVGVLPQHRRVLDHVVEGQALAPVEALLAQPGVHVDLERGLLGEGPERRVALQAHAHELRRATVPGQRRHGRAARGLVEVGPRGIVEGEVRRVDRPVVEVRAAGARVGLGERTEALREGPRLVRSRGDTHGLARRSDVLARDRLRIRCDLRRRRAPVHASLRARHQPSRQHPDHHTRALHAGGCAHGGDVHQRAGRAAGRTVVSARMLPARPWAWTEPRSR